MGGGRCLVRALEEVHLLAADLEPLHREAEVGRRDAREPEHVDVEARRLLEVARDDAHVVEADGDLHDRAAARPRSMKLAAWAAVSGSPVACSSSSSQRTD